MTPVVPDYDGGSIASIFPALLEEGRPAPWLPEEVRGARQVVLLVLDGLGWLQLRERASLAPTLAAMRGGPVTSVVPSTTSAALMSITVGAPPGEHGVVGYRMRVGDGELLNVLRWRVGGEDASTRYPPASIQPVVPFRGRSVPVVTKAEFAGGGFTSALLGDGRPIEGYWTPSGIAVEVRRLLRDGAPYVYAYYDGVDKVAHVHGFGEHYDAELATADRIVADLCNALPPDAALLVTADHGQVEVGDRIIQLDDEVRRLVAAMSGEGRFRWLHAHAGGAAELASAARRYDDDGLAWVRTRDEVVASGWFGPIVPPTVLSRVGDVVLAARAPVTFGDPADADAWLVCRHGSLTAEEMLVPLVGARR